MSQIELAERIGIAPMNLSRIKTGRVKAIRLSTLERLCEELQCQPGELLEYMSAVEAQARGFIPIEIDGESSEL